MKRLILILILSSIYIFIILLLMFVNVLHLSMNGFAVDSKNKIYIARDSCIEVYEDCAKQLKINPITSRGYNFHIDSNDFIFIETSTDIFKLDLNGNLVEKMEQTNNKYYYKSPFDYKVLEIENGKVYKWKSICLFNTITKTYEGNTMTVYRDNVFVYVLKILFGISFLTVIISINILVFISNKYRVTIGELI